jgi:beta-lactamase class A
MSGPVVLLCSLLAIAPAETPPLSALEGQLSRLIDGHKGKVAVGVKHLGLGEQFFNNADTVMPTASLIKIAVMIEAYQQADAGKIKLSDTITLRDEDKVPGSGVLTNHFSAGATFSVRDAVRLMMAHSDNTATNLVLDRIGIEAVNQRMKEWGFPETRLNAKVFRGSTTSVDRERSRLYGLGSTTAREMVGILDELQAGSRNRPAVKQTLLTHLASNEDQNKFKRFLPAGTRLAHKDGQTQKVRTDAGIIHTPTGPVAVCVLTCDNEDERWAIDNAGNLLCARIAEAVYKHYAPAKDKKP